MSTRKEFTVNNFKKYIYKRCLEHCRNTEQSNYFVDYLFNNKEEWECFLCKTNLIEIGQNNKIYMNYDTIIDHYHINNKGKGPIRGLLCKSCNIKEGKINADIINGISFNNLINKYKINYGKYFMNNIELYYSSRGGIWPMDTSED